jgi:hypothetical protein
VLDGTLIIRIAEKRMTVGGEIQDDEILGKMIAGGEERILKLDSPEIVQYSLGQLQFNHENVFAPVSIQIGETSFWAFNKF